LSSEELRKIHAYWRVANYLSVGQIHLMDNPHLKELLKLKHVKPRLFGHWGTTSGHNFHGYPWLIHRLTCRRTNHKNLHMVHPLEGLSA
jgi:phosphoketolase